MSNKPSAAWYLAPIFLGIIGSAIMWYVLKDEDHPDARKMIRKGWIIGIILTVIDIAWWIPFMLIPFAFMGVDHQQIEQQMGQQTQQQIGQQALQQAPQPAPETVQRMIPQQTTEQITLNCSGSAGCFTGIVTRVVDGDTIHVDGNSIRFTLASTPEPNEFGGLEAKQFVEEICPVGSTVLVDEDDGQTEGSYGRMIAVIYCNGINLNEAVIEEGHGYLDSGFCSTSEFSTHSWAQKYGCGTTIQIPVTETAPQPPTEPPTQTIESCDPSYPDVCIAPYPPDLDCGEISYRNFKVLPPDPHRFDGDKDGIGCES